MSSPENIDPTDDMAGPSASPEEQQEPRKTRYGRVIVRKGDLPGENQIPKNRTKKKAKPEEPVKPKRKYTKRKVRTSQSNEKDEAPLNENKPVEVKKDIKEEEPELFEMESDGEEYNDNNPPRPIASYNNGVIATDHIEACDLCGMEMEAYKIELHKLDNHPEHAPYECLSCRIRSFFDYWSLKEHYKICSNGRIGCDGNKEAPTYRGVIEAAFFRKCYQPVECPYCRIYLASYFDLDVHFTAHGLAQFDSKFACNGCDTTFISIEALKKHLTKQNTPKQSQKCFNSGRVLTRAEIEKLKERFADADRKECIRKFDLDTYVLAAPKILECVQEATCAYCDRSTKAYALLKTDLSNLVIYGLECSSEKIEKDIIGKISHCKKKINDRVCICRHHFQWRNWQTKKIPELKPKIVDPKTKTKMAEKREEHVEPKGLAQKVVKRIEDETIVKKEVNNGVANTNDPRSDNPSSSGHNSHSNQQKSVKIEEEDDYEERLFEEKEIKKEEPYWDEDWSRDRNGEMEYDVIDLSDDDGDVIVLPPLLNEIELEEKVAACMRIGHNCPVCEKTFPNLGDVHSHQSVHPEIRLMYSCADCPGKSFHHPDDILKHFDEKMKSALAGFYSYKVDIHPEDLSNIQNEKVKEPIDNHL